MKIGGCLSQNLAIAISLFNSPLIFLALSPTTTATSIEEFECNRLISFTCSNPNQYYCLFPFPFPFSLPSLLPSFLSLPPPHPFLLTNTTKLKHVRFPFLVSKYQDRNMFKLQSYSLFLLLLYIIYNLFC